MIDNIHNHVTLQDVWRAHNRLASHLAETPLQRSPAVSIAHEASIYVKLEHMHEIGAFKIRGATNKMLALSAYEKSRGVTTFSTGNHGLAVAYMAKKLGVKAVICISKRVPNHKVQHLKNLGADVIQIGEDQDDAEKHAYKLQEEEGLNVIPPFDDKEVIAGQGTIGLELIKQLPELDMVIIPVSGGGLFAGISFVLKQYNPDIKIIGVSMEQSPVMYESLQADKVVSLQEADTLADSLLGGIGHDNQYTFSMVKENIDDFVLLTEEEIARGMTYMLQEHQFAVEGAAATGIAAILSGKVQVKDQHVATIITGRNVDASVVLDVCMKYM